jgi:hypothetical protein
LFLNFGDEGDETNGRERRGKSSHGEWSADPWTCADIGLYECERLVFEAHGSGGDAHPTVVQANGSSIDSVRTYIWIGSNRRRAGRLATLVEGRPDDLEGTKVGAIERSTTRRFFADWRRIDERDRRRNPARRRRRGTYCNPVRGKHAPLLPTTIIQGVSSQGSRPN